MSLLKLGAGVLVAVGVAMVLAHLNHAQTELRTENDSLRQQLTQLQSENESLSKLLAEAGSSKKSSGEQLIELLKLRNDVRALQQQAGEVGKLREQIQRLQTVARDTQSSQAQSTEALERQQQAAMASLNHARQGVLAFIMFADENQARFPATFTEAAPFFKNGLAPIEMNFEIVYIGSITNITNAADTVVLREKHPSQTLDGKWRRTYGFADGHAEVHAEPDGNFDNWESQHIAPPPANQWSGKSQN